MPNRTYLQRIAGVEPVARVLTPPRGLFPSVAVPAPATTGVEEVAVSRAQALHGDRVAETKPATLPQTSLEPAVDGVELEATPPRVAPVVPVAFEPSVPTAVPPEPAPPLRTVEPPPEQSMRPQNLVPAVDRRTEKDETLVVHPLETTASPPRPPVAAPATNNPIPTIPPPPSEPRLQPGGTAPIRVTPATRSPDTEASSVSEKSAESPNQQPPVLDVVPPIRLEPPVITPPLPRSDNGGDNAKVRIGSLEVRITAPAVPTPASPPSAPAPARREATRPATGLARGFRSFGLRQG